VALRLALIIKLVDQASGPAKKLVATTKNLGSSFKQVSKEGSPAGRVIDRVRAATAKAVPTMTRAAAAARRLAGRAGLGAILLSARLVGYGIRGLLITMGALIRTTVSLGAHLVGLTLAAATAGVGMSLNLGWQIEQLDLQLQRIEKDGPAAAKALGFITDYARGSIFKVLDIGEAWITLKKAGLDPTAEAFRAIGDAAAGSRTDIKDAATAVAEATAGNVGSLKALGITAEEVGDRIVMTYTKAGQKVKRVVKNDARSIRAESMAALRDLYAGSADKQLRTFRGLILGIRSYWESFQLRLGQAGLFDNIKGKLAKVFGYLESKAKDGTLNRWADQISNKLSIWADNAEKFVTGTDWAKVGREIKEIATSVGHLASDLAKILRYVQQLPTIDPWAKMRLVPDGFEWTDLIPGSGLFKTPPSQRGRGAVTMPRSRPTPPGGPLKPGAPRVVLPAGGWPRQGPSHNKVSLQISTDPGVKTRVTEMRAAPGTKLDVSRGRLGMVG
jgi:phage tail tape-measure protein